jgi:hypothetical protein
MAKKPKINAFMAYWDTLGFEWIVNVTDYEKQKCWAALKGDAKVDMPIPRYAIIRARANPQRFPEIWAFESELTLKELQKFAHEHPQALATAVRNCGQAVFKTPREEAVIQ